MTVRMNTFSESRRGLLLVPIVAGCLYLLRPSERPKAPEFKVKEVLLDEAKVLIAAGAAIVDVRDRAAYEASHIAGALLAPLALLSAGIPAALADARSLPVIVYCGDGSTLGPSATHVLNQAGFAGAVNLKPGFQNWVAAGLPVEQGAGKSA